MKRIIIVSILLALVAPAYSLPTPPQYLQLCDNTSEGTIAEIYPEGAALLIEVVMPAQYKFAEYIGTYIYGSTGWTGWYVIYNAERQLIWRREIGSSMKEGWSNCYAGKYIGSGRTFYVGAEANYSHHLEFGMDGDPPHHYYKNWVRYPGGPGYKESWQHLSWFAYNDPMIRVQVVGSPAVEPTSLGRVKAIYR